MSGAIIFVVACALSFVLIWALRFMPAASAFVDSPTKPQAMHSQAVPRYGGLGIIGAIALVSIAAMWMQPASLASWCWPLGAAMALVGFVSIVDDVRNVPALVRLCVHALAAVLVVSAVWPLFAPPLWSLAISLTVAVVCVLGVAWSVNLFNFMDGVNGMVAVSSAVGLLGLAVLGAPASLTTLSTGVIVLCYAGAGAAAGFWPHNLGGRVFMGDLGSTGLGLLTASVALIGSNEALWQWWIPLVVFAPMIADTTWTLFRRALRGQPVWESHREHIYQRLVMYRGWTHIQVTALYAGLTLVGVSAIVVYRQFSVSEVGGIHPLLVGWVLKYVALIVITEAHLREGAQS